MSQEDRFAPYELGDVTYEGVMAAAFRMLDGRDPVANDLPCNDMEVCEELHLLYPEMRWCPQLLCTVVPTGYGTYRRTQGDSTIVTRVATLNDARRLWAIDCARNHSDKALSKRAADMARHAGTANNGTRIDAVARLFKSTHAIDQATLDSDPMALGTPTGVVDLRTGDVREVGEGKRVTMSCGTDLGTWYHTDDERWERFVLEIMCGDEGMADYLQRALGYSCMGGNPEECMFVAYGPTTRNGKDTLLESVRHALGEYATVGERTFLSSARKDGGTDEALAALAGKRLVTISEPPKGMPLDEGRVKDVTACGEQTTSKKYGAQFTFKPQFTIWMNVNHLPKVSDDSVFEGERIRVIPFNRHFSKEERDPKLKARFVTEEGTRTVLRWLVAGYRKYREHGLAEPAPVRKATEQYAGTAGTSLDVFVRECCVLGQDYRTENKSLRETYEAYCEHVLGEHPLSARRMRSELMNYAVTKRRSHGADWWEGIALEVTSDPDMFPSARVHDGEGEDAPEASRKGRNGTQGGSKGGRIMLTD